MCNFFLKKKCFVLEISRLSSFCEIHRFENLLRHHRHSYIMKVTLSYPYIFSILSTIKMKFGQILVCWVANISNMLLAKCWWLETSSRSFYDFIKLEVYRELSIFKVDNLPFLIIPYSPFEKSETLESWHNCLLGNWSRLLNWKRPGS